MARKVSTGGHNDPTADQGNVPWLPGRYFDLRKPGSRGRQAVIFWEAGRAGLAGPELTLSVMVKAIDKVLDRYDWPEMKAVRLQMDHQDFLKYICAKIGAV